MYEWITRLIMDFYDKCLNNLLNLKMLSFFGKAVSS